MEIKSDCHLDCIIEDIDRTKCLRTSFNIGALGDKKAKKIQDIADCKRRERIAGNLDFDPNWLDKICDYDVFCWAVSLSSKCFTDIISEKTDENGVHYLLPDATPSEYDHREARLKSVVQNQRGRSDQPGT